MFLLPNIDIGPKNPILFGPWNAHIKTCLLFLFIYLTVLPDFGNLTTDSGFKLARASHITSDSVTMFVPVKKKPSKNKTIKASEHIIIHLVTFKIKLLIICFFQLLHMRIYCFSL